MKNTFTSNFQPVNPTISVSDLDKGQELLRRLYRDMQMRLVGLESLQTAMIVALLANGHMLVEASSGLGKNTAIEVLASATAGTFSCIQCTPDLAFNDVFGSKTFNHVTNTHELQLGPIFANFLALNDINHVSAKMQSVCLSFLSQRQTVVDQVVYRAPQIFFAVATQSPVESEQTTPLTSPWLDRFLMKEYISYPTASQEIAILNLSERHLPGLAVITLDDVFYLQNLAQRVYVSDAIKQYIVELIQATRQPEKYFTSDVADYIDAGASPRAALALLACSKSLALISGRSHVIPSDIQALRYATLRHRINLSFIAYKRDVSPEQVIDAIFSAVLAPR